MYLVFIHMNARNDYDLFRKWMRISGELSVNNKGDCQVVGMSSKEYKNFWSKERNFNFFWYWAVSGFNLIVGLLHCVPLFLLPSETSWCIYILFQTFSAFSCVYTIFYFLHSVCTTTIFILQIMHYFSLKFKCIGRRLARLDALGAEKLNKRLAKLILDFNRVQLELIEVNAFFRNFLGTNIIFCFFIAILCMFLGIFLSWLLKVALLSAVFVLYLTIIMVPFRFANSIPFQVIQLRFVCLSIKRLSSIGCLFHLQRGKTRRQLEKLSFDRSVSVWNKQKIDSISHLSNTVGFTCFDWFLLDSHKALLFSFELIIYILLMVQTYFFYTTGFYDINQS